jgi:transposase
MKFRIIDATSKEEKSSVNSGNYQPSLFENYDVIAHEVTPESLLCRTSRQKSRSDAMQQTVTLETPKKPKPTYAQESWHNYNVSQRNEKGMFLSLLFELCEGIFEPHQHMGRKRASLRDIIFGITLKNYTTLSGRRNSCDIDDAFEKGYLEKPLAYNTLFKYMQNDEITILLRDMIKASSLPLLEVETDFAFDSTGFGTPNFKRWYDMKYGNTEDWHDWYKLHACVGVKTGIVTSFEISERHAHDSKFFKPLFNSTKENGFVIERVFADKAYPTKANLRLVVNNDAKPYIPFKSNAKFSPKDTVWNNLLHYYTAFRDEFYKYYHLRSNVESVFSAQKRKFGSRLTSRQPTSQINEMMAKLLAYNICVVSKSIYDLDIEPNFKM